MNRAILLLLFSAISAVCALAAEPWPSVPFTEVRAYAWPDDHVTEAVILGGMALKPGVINKEGALLTAEQIARLRTAVTGAYPKHHQAMCYVPHNAFVFYNAAKKPVAFVEVCFSCLGYRAAPKGTVQPFDLLALAKLFDELKLPMGPLADYEAFKKHFQPASN